MALLKPITTEHGTVALYWKITSAVFNLDGSSTIAVSGFYNQDTRNTNQTPLKILNYTIQIPFNLVDAYEYLKTTPEFSFGFENV
jgi:hypothetical protein